MLAGCARHASFIFPAPCAPAGLRPALVVLGLPRAAPGAGGPGRGAGGPKKRGPEGPRCYAFWVMRWNSRMASSAVSTSKRFKFFSSSLAR